MPAVSVITPIFNVSRFIKRCAESLFSQSLTDVEYVFIDDASPDESMAILHDVISHFPERQQSIKIVTHVANKGLAAARNSGMSIATGDYIFHCDSDDWLEPNALESLLNMANEGKYDLVYCDFYISFERNERYMKSPDFHTGKDLLARGFLGGTAKYNVWNKLVRRSIYTDNRIMFPEGYNMGEDMTMIRACACCDKVAHLPQALYHYVKINTGAYSNTSSPKNLSDIKVNANRTISFIENRFGNEFSKEIALFKLSIKLPFLISDNPEQHRLWTEWYPEANLFVMANKELPLRTRILQFAASKRQFWVVKLYYKIFYKFVYGFLYK